MKCEQMTSIREMKNVTTHNYNIEREILTQVNRVKDLSGSLVITHDFEIRKELMLFLFPAA